MCHFATFTAARWKWISLTNHARFSLSANVAKSYYDTLGVTPHCTQNEIKTAYYKLSKQYHPDTNKGSEEAIVKFRDITEAYEILGNFRLKKLYDKGLLHTAGSQFAQAPGTTDDDDTKFYKSRLRRDKPPTPTGRTPIYNFDEWSRAHYGSVFAKQAAEKARSTAKKARELREIKEADSDSVIFGIMFIVFCLYFWVNITRDKDIVSSEDSD